MIELRAIKLAGHRLRRPGSTGADLSHLLLRYRRYRLALGVARLVAALEPRNARCQFAVAKVAHQSGRVREAVSACHILATLPDASVAMRFGAATILYESNEVQACLALLDTILQGAEQHPHARFLHAVARLKAGDFKLGWPAYETRFSGVTEGKAIRTRARRWQGEPLAGKRILVYCEQGFGDCLQFVRFVPLLKARGAHTILWSYPELLTLFEQSQVADEVVTGDDQPAADYVTFLASIPAAMNLLEDKIPTQVPYLRAKPDAVERWRRRWPGDQFRIGLIWGGGARVGNRSLNEIDQRRSFPPSLLERLEGFPARWVSLQMGDHALKRLRKRPRLSMDDPTEELCDFADTAAACEALDLIISVDTSMAHLAGALGRPVWMLSRFDACWRWLLDRSDTPWYPTMRIFRQPKPADWLSVVSALLLALRAEASRRSEADSVSATRRQIQLKSSG